MSISPTGGIGINFSASIGGASGSAPTSGGATGADMGTPSIGSNGMDLNSMIPGGLESLVNAMQDFTSAEILMALMMMAAAGGKDDDEESGGGSAAMGLLMGMAMAGGLGQSLNIQLDISIQGVDAGGQGGGLGGQMDMTA